MVNVKKVRNFGAHSRIWDVFIKSFPSRRRELCGRGCGKRGRTRSGGWLPKSRIFQTHQGQCGINSPRLAACVRFIHVWTRQNTSTQGSKHKVPPLTRKLFSTDTCWERKNLFFSPMKCQRFINNTPEQAPCPGITGQHKLTKGTPWFFLGILFYLDFSPPSVILVP